MDEREWMPGIEHVPTEAYGYADVPPGGMQAVAVMSHIMQGYQRTMLAWARERPFVTPKSAHFTIARDGHVAQHVGIFDPAWAAGYVARPSWALCRGGTNPNRYLVHIEHEGFSVPPGYGYDYVYDDINPWPPALIDASIAVHRWVFAQLDIEASADTVIGHRDTDSVYRADDPGAAWPREAIIEALRAPAASSNPSAGQPFAFDGTDLRWPEGQAARLIQAVLQGRVAGHEYVEWRGRVLPSVVLLDEPEAAAP